MVGVKSLRAENGIKFKLKLRRWHALVCARFQFVIFLMSEEPCLRNRRLGEKVGKGMWLEDCRWIENEVESLYTSMVPCSQNEHRLSSFLSLWIVVKVVRSNPKLTQCVSPCRKWHRTCVEVLEAHQRLGRMKTTRSPA